MLFLFMKEHSTCKDNKDIIYRVNIDHFKILVEQGYKKGCIVTKAKWPIFKKNRHLMLIIVSWISIKMGFKL